jgi:hypothetical protein
MRWQIGLAKSNGIFGFCFYHYYFGNGKFLMQKPLQNYLRDKTLDFPFCLCWANHNWSRTWVGGDKDILMEVKYGDEKEWKYHFDYLADFFKDERYIRINNKPVLVLNIPQAVPDLRKMLKCYTKWAKEIGLEGLTFISQSCLFPTEEIYSLMDYFIEYQPNYLLQKFWGDTTNMATSLKFTAEMAKHALKSKLNKVIGFPKKPITYSYSAAWDFIIKHKPENEKMIAGAFVKCDVSPRRQERALIFEGDTPEKFGKYLKILKDKIDKEYSTDFLFLTAWNEWGEGMYLEPDEKNKYGYLEAIKKCM